MTDQTAPHVPAPGDQVLVKAIYDGKGGLSGGSFVTISGQLVLVPAADILPVPAGDAPAAEHDWMMPHDFSGQHHPPFDEQGCPPNCPNRLAREAAPAAEHADGPDRPAVVCLCGSTRFKDDINRENARLTLEGKIVISLGLFGHTDMPDHDWTTDGTDLKRMLDNLHKRKIDLADEVFIVNVGGYIGESTRGEIDYAEASGKPVRYLEPLAASPSGAAGRGEPQ
jgi:hypothetical protein